MQKDVREFIEIGQFLTENTEIAEHKDSIWYIEEIEIFSFRIVGAFLLSSVLFNLCNWCYWIVPRETRRGLSGIFYG